MIVRCSTMLSVNTAVIKNAIGSLSPDSSSRIALVRFFNWNTRNFE